MMFRWNRFCFSGGYKGQNWTGTANGKTTTTQEGEEWNCRDWSPCHELLDTTAGMSNSGDIELSIGCFPKTLEEYKNKKGQKIVFIHGKGDGVLRKSILQELKYKYKTMKVRDACSVNMVSGLMMVIIH